LTSKCRPVKWTNTALTNRHHSPLLTRPRISAQERISTPISLDSPSTIAIAAAAAIRHWRGGAARAAGSACGQRHVRRRRRFDLLHELAAAGPSSI
jgi:hypothetical protein